MLVPKKLQIGDTVGIITPSYPSPSFHPERLKKGIAVLESEFGLKVQLGKSVSKRTGHLAGSHEERAEDINQFLADPSIRGIWCASGGFNSNALLGLIDYRPILKDPKPIIGYSDATALLMAIFVQTGMVTFYGPTVCRELGGYSKPFPYTIEHCKKALFESAPLGKLSPPPEWTTDSPTDLEREKREPLLFPGSPWHWVKQGLGSGRLIGGNLQTLLVLHGTSFWPPLQDAIFFWEEVDIHMAQVHRHLTQCRMLGIFDRIAGMVIGQPNLKSLESELTLEEVVLDVTKGFNFPILSDVDCSHTEPMLTLPLGAQARLNSKQDLFSIEESAVV